MKEDNNNNNGKNIVYHFSFIEKCVLFFLSVGARGVYSMHVIWLI